MFVIVDKNNPTVCLTGVDARGNYDACLWGSGKAKLWTTPNGAVRALDRVRKMNPAGAVALEVRPVSRMPILGTDPYRLNPPHVDAPALVEEHLRGLEMLPPDTTG